MSSIPTRENLLRWFEKNRNRSRELFAMIEPSVYYDRPIPVRNPIVFYEGHLSAFNVNTLIKLALSRKGIDDRLEELFAAGIDPETEAAAGTNSPWPNRDEVTQYCFAADSMVRHTLESIPLSDTSSPFFRNSEVLLAILEHEPMHHETLLYMFHRLSHEKKSWTRGLLPKASRLSNGNAAVKSQSISIPAGKATIGVDDDEFGWDNERHQHVDDVPAFSIDSLPVTNGQFLEFIDAGGYENASLWDEEGWEWVNTHKIRHPLFWEKRGIQWMWRGMKEYYPLPPHSPVYATNAEASAYARLQKARLVTEAEYHRAAFGTPEGAERLYPWGDEPPRESHGNFDFHYWDPAPVGSYPQGASAWGVHELVGNGWEWTSTIFDGFDGFSPMVSYPNYSVGFFDGKHYVMKGASPVTAKELVRKSFRNWFRGTYPYVYAKFRCVRAE
ncbi:MAG TPA: SUMF1/EgtB/PvdO family nonheme iron enzyme [Thermoanaerobaculia bacterium]|nr:SUMF1/EgtB/PvdO family nonheme iron enzyme [Thermoanaerobaculia bacterium]